MSTVTLFLMCCACCLIGGTLIGTGNGPFRARRSIDLSEMQSQKGTKTMAATRYPAETDEPDTIYSA